MQSFRSELEDLNNPVVAKDIIDLEKKILLFREGKIDSDKFRSLRLARGIYGQRQPGVQMDSYQIAARPCYDQAAAPHCRYIGRICQQNSACYHTAGYTNTLM